MHSHALPDTTAAPRTLRAWRAPAALALMLAILASSFAALAIASGALVSATRNGRLGEILVNAQGRTLYVLSPETSRHLLCKSSSCLAIWPALTVSSRSTKLAEGSGVHGSLGLLARGRQLQVTLNGLPLYLYVGDSTRGQANGEDLKSFGGTWHAVTSSGHPR